jgi:hypothetical protein
MRVAIDLHIDLYCKLTLIAKQLNLSTDLLVNSLIQNKIGEPDFQTFLTLAEKNRSLSREIFAPFNQKKKRYLQNLLVFAAKLQLALNEKRLLFLIAKRDLVSNLGEIQN